MSQSQLQSQIEQPQSKVSQLLVQNAQQFLQIPQLATGSFALNQQQYQSSSSTNANPAPLSAKQILDQIINVQDASGLKYRQKYTFDFVHSLISSNLPRYEKLFKEYSRRGIDVTDFIYVMLNSIEHGQHETLFIVIALIDFFQQISESDRCGAPQLQLQPSLAGGGGGGSTSKQQGGEQNDKGPANSNNAPSSQQQQQNSINNNNNNNNNIANIANSSSNNVASGGDSLLIVRFEDITNFITENNPLASESLPDNRKIASRYLPPTKRFNLKTNQRIVRVIDTKAPLILRDNDVSIRRLNKEHLVIDSIHHNNNLIIASHYAEQIQRLITVDSYSDQFFVYSLECQVEHKVQPKAAMVRGQVCIDFCWSDKQNRFGATFRDQFLGFWDAGDKFEFEQIFHIGECVTEDQLHLWYINCIDRWVTTDRKCMLYIWNLEQEKIESTIKSHEDFKGGILSLVEITYLQMVAVAAQENSVSLWDFINQKQLFKISVSHNHIHSLFFFNTFQVLITAGYDAILGVYNIHPDYNDYNKIGELSGHNSLVTAMTGVEGSPMVISADDRFTIKVWDIRKMICIQNFELELRSPIRFMHVFPDSVCFVSSRITCIYFDEEEQGAGILLQKQKKRQQQQKNKHHHKSQQQQLQMLQPHNQTSSLQQQNKSVQDDIHSGSNSRHQQQQQQDLHNNSNNMDNSNKSPLKQEDPLYPISVEYNEQSRELFVATKKDVRVLDIFTGQTRRIFGNITHTKEDEITDFLMFQQHKRLLVGSQKGAVKGFSSLNSEELFSSQLHQEQVTAMRMDYLNGLLITVSTDASLAVSRPANNGSNSVSGGGAFEKLREVSNVMNGKEITLLEVSVYHNLIVTGNSSPCLCFWSYEFGRLIATLILETDNEPTVLQFINGYAILAIGTCQGYVYFVLFSAKDDQFDLELVANIQLQKTIYLQQLHDQKLLSAGGGSQKDEELLSSYYKKEEQRRRQSKLVPIGQAQQQLQQQQQQNLSNFQSSNQKTQRKSQIMNDMISSQSNKSVIVNNTLKVNNNISTSKNDIFSTAEKRPSAASIRLEQLQSLQQTQTQKNQSSFSKQQQSSQLEIPRLNIPGIVSVEQSEFDNQEELDQDNDNFNNNKNYRKESLLHPTKMLVKLAFSNNTQEQNNFKNQEQQQRNSKYIPVNANMLIGMNNGEIWDYNIQIMFQRDSIMVKEHSNRKTNYNAYRHYKDDFENILNNHKVYSFFIEKNRVRRDILVIDNLKQTDLLKKFKQSVIKIESANNLIKTLQQDESERPLDPYFGLSNNLNTKFKAHKEQLTVLQHLPVNENLLITASNDNYLKIWQYPQYQLVCSINITHPLPTQWQLKPDFTKEYEGKVLFALQAMQCTQQKYKSRLSLLQEKMYNVAEVFKYIQQQHLQQIALQQQLFLQQQEELKQQEQQQEQQQQKTQNTALNLNTIQQLNQQGEQDQQRKQQQQINQENLRHQQQQLIQQQQKAINSASNLNMSQQQNQSEQDQQKKQSSNQLDNSSQHQHSKKSTKAAQNPQQQNQGEQEQQKKQTGNLENFRYQQQLLEEQKNNDQQQQQNQQNLQQEQKEVILMKDFYSPRDLIYDKIKQIYQKELQGPSLKHIAESKRIYNAQIQWRNKLQSEQDELQMQLKYQSSVPEDKQKEQKQLIQFLDPNFREQLFKKKYDFLDRIAYIDKLDSKLDKQIEESQRNRANNINIQQQLGQTFTILPGGGGSNTASGNQSNQNNNNNNPGGGNYGLSMIFNPNINQDQQQQQNSSQRYKINTKNQRAKSIPKNNNMKYDQSPTIKQNNNIRAQSQEPNTNQQIQLYSNLQQSQILFLHRNNDQQQSQSPQNQKLIKQSQQANNNNNRINAFNPIPISQQLLSTNNTFMKNQFNSTITVKDNNNNNNNNSISKKNIASSQQNFKNSFHFNTQIQQSQQQQLQQNALNQQYYKQNKSPSRKKVKTEPAPTTSLPTLAQQQYAFNEGQLRILNNDFFAKVEDYGSLIQRDYQFIQQAQNRGGQSFFDYAKKKSYLYEQMSFSQNNQTEKTNLTNDQTSLAMNSKSLVVNGQDKSSIQHNQTTEPTAATGVVTSEATLTTDRLQTAIQGMKPSKHDNSIQMRKTESKFFGNVIKNMNNKVKKSKGFLVSSHYKSFQTLPQQPLNSYLQQSEYYKNQNIKQKDQFASQDKIKISYSSLIDQTLKNQNKSNQIVNTNKDNSVNIQ